MKEIIKKIILENQDLNVKNKPRDFKFLIKTNKIISLIGPRRVGKSYLLFNEMSELKKKGFKSNILYINFDDERLLPLSVKDLDLIIESYFELFPENLNSQIFVFFDEIQNIIHWELFVRRLYDKNNLKIYVTGSSSKLLSKEIATSLRGRTLSFNIFPLSFKEYLEFNDIKLDSNFKYSSQRFLLKKEFKNYLKYGGFPEIIFEELKFKTLQSYLDLTIYKDLIQRYSIRNLTLLKYLIKFLLSNISKEFSINSYYNKIKQELNISRETITEYNSYLEDINLIQFLNKFDSSIKKQHSNQKKVYSIDTGFVNANGFKFSEDIGRLYENLVFIELKRNEKEIYFHKLKKECDFLIKEDLKIIQAIQVTVSIKNEITRKRELEGLIEAMKTYNLNTGLILTQDEEDELIIEGKKIIIKPVHHWLLENNIGKSKK